MEEVTVLASPIQTKLHIIYLIISFVFDVNEIYLINTGLCSRGPGATGNQLLPLGNWKNYFHINASAGHSGFYG